MDNSQVTTHDTIIVGAGIAGLTAGSLLQARGRSVLVLEANLNVGGRLATRRLGPGYADYGAQFFTVRDELFARDVETWGKKGLVYVWSHGWSGGSLDTAKGDGHPRYAVTGGMYELAAYLAMSLKKDGLIATSTQVIRLTVHDTEVWRVQTANGRSYTARSVILTCPAPLSVDLLVDGEVPLTDEDFGALKAIRYAPSLCGLFWVDGSICLPEPGGLQMQDGAVSWVADNKLKGISPAARILTVHASPAWSEAHYDHDAETILEELQAELGSVLKTSTVIRNAQLERWKYALPLTVHPDRMFAPEDAPTCLLGGDGFGAPRVEGAYLSGVVLALEADRALDAAG